MPISVYGDVDLADRLVRGDVEQPVPAARPADRDDRAVGQEAVRRAVEQPGRVGELGLERRERLEPRARGEPVDVPPARPVADEVEDAVGRPLRLGDRFVDAARGQIARAEAAVVDEGGDPQARGVPRHVGVIPFEPGEPPPVGRRTRRGEEIRALVQDARRTFAVERDVDDRGARLAVAGVVLADGQEPPASRVEAEVGVAIGALGRDRLGRVVAGVEPVQPAVRHVREQDRAAGDGIGATTVLVDPRPDVEWRRGHVTGRPVG